MDHTLNNPSLTNDLQSLIMFLQPSNILIKETGIFFFLQAVVILEITIKKPTPPAKIWHITTV